MAHVFSSEFYEIFKNTFFCRTPPVAASQQVSIAYTIGVSEAHTHRMN